MKCAAALVLLLSSLTSSSAQSRRAIILVDGLSVNDLKETYYFPALTNLYREGGIGLMNASVAGPPGVASEILTMARGIRTSAEATDNDAYNGREIVEGDPASVVYRRRTGQFAPDGSVVHLGIASLIRRGALGSLAGDSDWFVCGNSDTDRPGRAAALLAIDRRGLAHGRVGSDCLRPDADRPFGVGDDPPRLAAMALGCRQQNVVIRLGDGARAEAVRPRISSPSYYIPPWHDEDLKELDRLIALLRPGFPEILVLSVQPFLGQWDRLLPVIYYRQGAPAGLLTSLTTRTPGVVANVDVMATLMNESGRPLPSGIEGRPIRTIPIDSPLTRLEDIDLAITNSARAQIPVFAILAAVAALVLFGGLLMLSTGWSKGIPTFTYARGYGLVSGIRTGVLFLLSMPLAMLLAVPLARSDPGRLTAAIPALMLVCAIVVGTVSRRAKADPPTVMALLTGIAILVDVISGQNLIKFSVFSAYMVQGFRFYGIGNEYMGVLIGATLLTVFSLGLKPAVAMAVFAVTAFILGWPGIGANAGGLIAAVVAFGAGWLILGGRNVSWKAALGLAILGLVAAVGFALSERLFSIQSHFGGAMSDAGSRGIGHLAAIVARKTAMNLGILVKPFTLIGLAAAVGLIWLAGYRMRTLTRQVIETHPGWSRGMPAAGWGALAAFLFNDSGIVAALFIVGTFMVAGIYYLFEPCST